VKVARRLEREARRSSTPFTDELEHILQLATVRRLQHNTSITQQRTAGPFTRRKTSKPNSSTLSVCELVCDLLATWSQTC